MTESKPYAIAKSEVMAAWQQVKANRGAAGIDGESIAAFEAKLKDNLYKLWNRMSSGSYFPPPVRRVSIPKGDGRWRTLGVPTVADRVAQTVVTGCWSHWWNRSSMRTPTGTDRTDRRCRQSGCASDGVGSRTG